MTFGDFIVSKQVGFQAFLVNHLWDSSDGKTILAGWACRLVKLQNLPRGKSNAH
jgi:hypothetical protein